MRRWLLGLALCATAWDGAAVGQSKAPGPQWTLQYFYDEYGKELHITDMAFPSATRGIAVGEIVDSKGRGLQHTAIVTSDAGAHWSLVPLKEFPRSVFFLDELAGWLVTDEGIWFTDEAGRSWKRLSGQIRLKRKLLDRAPNPGLLLRVWFLDPQHGFGVGLQKAVYETRDGGRTWTPVEEAGKPSTGAGAAYSVYSQIAFADARLGLIAGGYLPPRADTISQDGLPDWLVPERALNRLQQPLLSLEMETRDGGARWNTSMAAVFGSLESLRLAGHKGLAVFAYSDSFDWPSEVYRLDLTTGKSRSVFKRGDRKVTDTAIFPDGSAILAGVEPPGRLRSAPIPGKVKILTSTDLATWAEMPVDYRAVARRLVLAGPDRGHMWAATDTGMILRLAGR